MYATLARVPDPDPEDRTGATMTRSKRLYSFDLHTPNIFQTCGMMIDGLFAYLRYSRRSANVPPDGDVL